MQYLCLLYDDENNEPEDMGALLRDYFAFNAEAKAAGAYVGGDALQPTSTATSVQVRDGAVHTTDGPFAETKEQLGGYYLIEAADLDEAIRWASKIPAAKTGTVEVRPIMVIPGDG